MAAVWSPLVLLVCAGAMADIVMHNPRGSNNRLNENTANRKNANRMFNSQNNNKGGYNVGDASDEKATNQDEQYNMKYFQSDASGGKTYLEVEWTNQHGCGDINGEGGGAQRRYCEQVLQYMCMDDVEGEDDFNKDTIRNGISTSKQVFAKIRNKNQIKNNAGKNNQVKDDRGLHETWDWYKQCYIREANGGLFLADQELQKNKLKYSAAIHTRQNSDGDRSGYECEEERDYWPYWAASPWIDVAVLTSDTSRCSINQATSTNFQTKGRCFQEEFRNRRNKNLGKVEIISKFINQADCEANGGHWHQVSSYIEKAELTEQQCSGNIAGTELSYAWRIPYDVQYVDNGDADEFSHPAKECLVIPGIVDCQQTQFSRMNHQGNTKDGQMMRYQWELPYFPSGEAKRCVFRMRYNISTFDYDPFNTDSTSNGEENSPIVNNPDIDVFTTENDNSLNLQLAINTAQFGRTFQDRSFVFKLLPREQDMIGKTMYNLNVRGRRGNIVQTYPSVEYDFTPNDLVLTTDDLLMIQWTGSNTNPDDAGQGRARTDRSNFVPVNDTDIERNVPTYAEDLDDKWSNAQVVWTYFDETGLTPADLYVNLASSGYYRCEESHVGCSQDPEFVLAENAELNNELDNAPASYGGVVLRFTDTGSYYFMCTRNNNFTNRSQKGGFTVVSSRK